MVKKPVERLKVWNWAGYLKGIVDTMYGVSVSVRPYHLDNQRNNDLLFPPFGQWDLRQ